MFNPNVEELTRKLKNRDVDANKAARPIMFIYSPAVYMSRYVGEFKDTLKNYQDVFDVYYTSD